jgi:hypothetical protein
MVMDCMHGLEYLWDAARAFHPGGAETAHVWVQERALKVLQGHAREVAAGRRRRATLRRVSDKQRAAVRAQVSFTPDDDGLALPCHGMVLVNPWALATGQRNSARSSFPSPGS